MYYLNSQISKKIVDFIQMLYYSNPSINTFAVSNKSLNLSSKQSSYRDCNFARTLVLTLRIFMQHPFACVNFTIKRSGYHVKINLTARQWNTKINRGRRGEGRMPRYRSQNATTAIAKLWGQRNRPFPGTSRRGSCAERK